MENKRISLGLALALLLSAFCAPLFSEEFSQKIEWKSNANAFEYKVEIQNVATGKNTVIKTEQTHAELSLQPGTYRYRVTAFDFLGREAGVSEWAAFEIVKASTPKIGTIDKNVKIDKKNNSVEISASISDVNANSTFELVNDSMQGTVDSSDRPKLSRTSETGSVSRLYFNDVPPGKWRLKVTNASGLSTLSDVITVEGEKMYTEEEIAKIKADAEEAVRKDMQKNLDKYIAEAEAEKADAEKRHAEEEARMKAEQEETEKRLAEEREKNERERIEAERAAKEAERQQKLAWKAAHPYKWKDVIFEAGAGYSYNLYDGTLSDYYGVNSTIAYTARLAFLPVKTTNIKFGMELCGTRQTLTTQKTNFYDAELISTLIDAKIVMQYKLSGRTYIALKGGVGIDMFDTNIEYSSDVYESRSGTSGSYFCPALTCGASLFFIPWKFLVFEAGCDFAHVMDDGMQTGFITPYACIGFRF